MPPIPGTFIALVTDTLEGTKQVVADGMGTTCGTVLTLVHICKGHMHPLRRAVIPWWVAKLQRPPFWAFSSCPRSKSHGCPYLCSPQQQWLGSLSGRWPHNGRSPAYSHIASLYTPWTLGIHQYLKREPPVGTGARRNQQEAKLNHPIQREGLLGQSSHADTVQQMPRTSPGLGKGTRKVHQQPALFAQPWQNSPTQSPAALVR